MLARASSVGYDRRHRRVTPLSGRVNYPFYVLHLLAGVGLAGG